MGIKSIIAGVACIALGAVGGYGYSLFNNPFAQDIHISQSLVGFSASYGALRNLREQGEDEASRLLYAFMNNSIKDLATLYEGSNPQDKQLILISFQGYRENIMGNPIFNDSEPDIDAIVSNLLNEYNKSAQ